MPKIDRWVIESVVKVLRRMSPEVSLIIWDPENIPIDPTNPWILSVAQVIGISLIMERPLVILSKNGKYIPPKMIAADHSVHYIDAPEDFAVVAERVCKEFT